MTMTEPLAVSVAQAVKLAGISRTHTLAEIKRGALEARKSGSRTLIFIDDLRAYLSALPEAIPRSDQD